MNATIHIGIAGWAIPPRHQEQFASQGTHLERYAERFNAVEINSSFYRPHRPATYERWAASTPEGFRFAVKMPRAITHEAALVDCQRELDAFLAQVRSLRERLGPLLVQLPPSLEYQLETAAAFFEMLRSRHPGDIVCEPRHATWFTAEAETLLVEHQIARVAADPARHPAADKPAGWPELAYYRLHGSPRIYYSAYDDAYLDHLAAELRARAESGATVWCIFDNTALGAAIENALGLQARLR